MTDQQQTETGRQAEHPDRNRTLIAGWVLILAGLGLFALQYLEGYGESVVLLVVGAAFLAGYVMRRSYGLLVPGAIVVGVGLGQLGQEIFDTTGDIEAVGVGVGFLLIYVIDAMYRGSTHWWPLIPGGILVVAGTSSLLDADVGRLLWPALLVLAGVVMLLGLNRRRT